MTPSAPGLILRGRLAFDSNCLFEDLDFYAKGGALTVLLGASGVGKSTILRQFAGLSEARLTGIVGTDDDKPLADRIALMGQSDALLPWASVVDNVCLGARLRGEVPDRDRALKLLADVGLDGFAARKPAALSGGQRQRVALARTLMEDRPIVLLDEPFSALDAATRLDMQRLAAGLLRGRTVLLVTHDANEAARLGDTILMLTRAGIRTITPPPGSVPRDHDAVEVLSFGAGLLTAMTEARA